MPAHQAMRRAATRVGDEGVIVGLDINDGMIAVAEESAADAELPIEWRLGDAADLPFSDAQFDVVCCQQAIQFFDDPDAALSEMHRVLTPTGRMISSIWRTIAHQPGNFVVAEAMERHGHNEAAEEVRSPYPAWDRDYLNTMAQGARFGDVSVTIEIDSERYPSIEEFIELWLAATPLADLPEPEVQTIRQELVQDVRTELLDYTDDAGVVFPNESYVIMARP
jgi:ubiquinone/menaquinone biosynthesis C-methylase UbiE